ncbi:uncharacterized protein TM35_000601040 [Trypanosoma theileri]|uniref:Surface protease GP63 n=1 Tax=Trypanosoma theileri TaxID=67003 RepID=A0A1X0NGU1_9TRYP|nr:uncharacterized protein TM35_000601040 [Trypanosoma theileri]ORC83673.1 hypothetical protein TM35_000601040 [Trypanosoma theileri]
MQLRRVLYFLALIMSVASVCVATGAAGNSGTSSSASSNSADECPPPPESDAGIVRDTPRDPNTVCAAQRPAAGGNGSGGTASAESGTTSTQKGNTESSSISSSVWMRVSLLIVVTLACILVC